MKDEPDSAKAVKLVMFLANQAFDFYFDKFTYDLSPTEDAKENGKARMAVIERVSPKKPQATVMKETMSLRYKWIV